MVYKLWSKNQLDFYLNWSKSKNRNLKCLQFFIENESNKKQINLLKIILFLSISELNQVSNSKNDKVMTILRINLVFVHNTVNGCFTICILKILQLGQFTVKKDIKKSGKIFSVNLFPVKEYVEKILFCKKYRFLRKVFF